MTNTISNDDNIIDSRDVIARIEELEACDGDLDEWDADELTALKHLQEQAEGSPDWLHGEMIINESYFTEYIEELITDCYDDIPNHKHSGWPYNHMTLDYEAAAGEAKQDYMEVDFNGNTFLIRG